MSPYDQMLANEWERHVAEEEDDSGAVLSDPRPRARGHHVGMFTFTAYGFSVNVRLYQADTNEEDDMRGQLSAEWAWAEADDRGEYWDVDDAAIVVFDHRDHNQALGEMAVLAMNEIGDRTSPDGAEY